MLSNAPVVVIDIDGVISDNTKRLKHLVVRKDDKPTVRREKPNWDKYTSKYKRDTEGLACPMLKLLLAGNPDLQVLFLTARRSKEQSWYHIHKFIGKNDKHLLACREAPLWEIDPNLPAPEFKRQHIQHLHEMGLRIVGFFDDSAQNCLAVQKAFPDVPVFRFMSHVRPEDYFSDLY